MNVMEQIHWTAVQFRVRINRKSHNENRILSNEETRAIIRDTIAEMDIKYKESGVLR